MRHKRKIIFFFTIIIFVICAFQIASLWQEFFKSKEQEVITMDPWIKKHWNHIKILTDSLNYMQSSKVILLWTKFFGLSNYVPKYSSLGCPLPKCFVTSNRDYLNRSHALIFHLRDMSLADLPTLRTPEQVWILLHHESPPHTPDLIKKLGGLFNWTATYRYDSEIILSPLLKKKKSEATNVASPARSKKKMVAWLVSNCKTPSNREGYAKELQKHIEVDIFGSCGPLSCTPDQKMSDECYDRLSSVYRYYLSFENSICKDYVTEKFFRIINTDMIPVVLGGANYSSIAPPNSFIDASSFKSPKDLALFLLKLAQDEKRYDSYFSWKKTYQMVHNHYVCQICQKLNSPIMSPSVYPNISHWWFHDANCRAVMQVPKYQL